METTCEATFVFDEAGEPELELEPLRGLPIHSPGDAEHITQPVEAP